MESCNEKQDSKTVFVENNEGPSSIYATQASSKLQKSRYDPGLDKAKTTDILISIAPL